MKRRIENLTFFLTILFTILAIYISYLQVINNTVFAQDPKNPRNLENFQFRGRIFDRRGEVIAFTSKTDDKSKRIYPQKTLFSPIIGYVHNRLGTEGIEKQLNSKLSGKRLPQNIYEAFAFINGKKLVGQDVYLTLDSRVQKIVTEAMDEYKGAIVVLDPSTGEILAIVSQPNFDPNLIETSWDKLKKDREAPLVTRAIDGSYPPGSTFKIFTLAVALQLGYVDNSTKYECPGYYDIGRYRIHEAKGGKHGTVSIGDALVYSCNVAFAQIGLKIGPYNFYEYVKNFKLQEPFEIGVPVKAAHFAPPSELTEGGLAQSAFGQGELALSPLHLALIASAIANDGKIMKPYLVKGIRSITGEDIYITRPQVWHQPISKETADRVKEIMVQVVDRGTGYRAKIPGIKVAGKTGTAENPHGETHAWFVGFAPAEKPKFLTVTILENAGYGGSVAAPIVGKILYDCLQLSGK